MASRLFYATAGVIAMLLALEVLLRLLPVSTATMTGYYLDADLIAYPPGHTWSVSTGWDLRNPQRLRSNTLGFASPDEFERDPDAVVLIGDSYVEASMLNERDRPAQQLRVALANQRKVYGMGTPGTALLDYAQRLRFAAERLGTTDFVVWLEPGDARQSICGSGNVVSRCLDSVSLLPRIERLPQPSWPKRALRQFALAQYLAGQLKLDPRRLGATAFARHVPLDSVPDQGQAASSREVQALSVSTRSREVVDAVVASFFSEIKPYLRGRLLFLADAPHRTSVAHGDELDAERGYLIKRLRAEGAEVVDLAPIYAMHAGASSLSLVVGPYDHHLNALGVSIVVSEVARRLRAGP